MEEWLEQELSSPEDKEETTNIDKLEEGKIEDKDVEPSEEENSEVEAVADIKKGKEKYYGIQ